MQKMVRLTFLSLHANAWTVEPSQVPGRDKARVQNQLAGLFHKNPLTLGYPVPSKSDVRSENAQ